VSQEGPAKRAPEHLIVGHVSKPHGTKGELFVWPLTDRPADVFADGETVWVGGAERAPDAESATLEVERTRPFKRGLLVKFTQHDDRNAVEQFAGQYLWLPIAKLSQLEEDEVYFHQLIDMEVVTVEGQVVGRVQEVFETAPAHLLEVRTADDKLKLVPFAERIVKKVDVAAGRIVIAPPAGLLDI
jgi:16S rRNA processing protein RimM